MHMQVTASSDLQFEHLTMADGLSRNDVNCIMRDSRGFMWFGTNDGLNKYDGYHFIVYKANEPDNIGGSDIQCIIEDSDSDIWIGTRRNGLILYNRFQDTFTGFLPDTSEENILSASFIRTIYQDSDQKLWIGTDNGIYQFDKQYQQFSSFSHDSKNATSLSHNTVYAISEDYKKRLWVATANGLNLFDRKTGTCVRYFHNPQNTTDQGSNLVRCLYPDASGNLWIGTYSGGLFQFNPDLNLKKHFIHSNTKNSISNNTILCVTGDTEGNIYIGTENGGLNVYNIRSESFKSYYFNIDDQTAISSNSIYSLYYSDDDILWAGTFNGGVNFSSKHTRRIRHYLAKQGGLNNPYILSLCEDHRGNIWIGTDGGGLNYFDRKNETFKYFIHDEENIKSISSNAVTAVYEDRFYNLWVGTYRGGLDLFNPKTEDFIHFRHNPDDSTSIQHDYVQTIYEDRQDVLYIGTFNGLDILNRKTNSFIHHPEIMSGVLCVEEDKQGNIWLGTYDGVRYIDKQTKDVTYFSHEFGDIDKTVPSIPNTIFKDSGENIWIGTTEGLYRFVAETQKFMKCVIQPDQSNIFIHDIAEDKDGNLWIGSNPGIYKLEGAALNPEDILNVVDLGVHDGIKSLFRTQSGEIVFGGNYGLNVFSPEDIKENSLAPPVVFTNLKIMNQDVGISSHNSIFQHLVNETKYLKFSHKHSVITFEFAALNYIQPEKNQYAYFMEGFDKDWNFVGNKRSATYTNLNPGEYVFRIKGSNNDGKWNSEGASIKIKIIPPLWKTKWAYTIYFLILVSLVYFARRIQLNRLRMEHELELEHLHAEKLEELDQLKSQFFSNITHEFRTPLTLIMGPVQQLLSGDLNAQLKEQYEIILRNSKKLYQLINQILELSKLEAGSVSLHTRKVNLVSELQRHLSYFSALAELKQIHVNFHVNGKFEIDEEEIPVYIDEEKIEKVVYNLISNAIKFTPENGQIFVYINESRCLIESMQSQLTSSSEEIPLLNKFGKLISGKKSSALSAMNSKAYPDGFVEIIVKDTGIGIPPESIDRVFDRFYQAESYKTQKYEGSGIGLALTKELVELHSGTIEAVSHSGEGAMFQIRLPLGCKHLKTEQIDESERETSSDQKNRFSSNENVLTDQSASSERFAKNKKYPLLLIVEDNNDLRNYLIKSLNTEYKIIHAVDGKAGVSKAVEHIPDLIISDIVMPEMDGIELCHQLKDDERTSHIPIILLTAKTSKETKLKGLETGADDYIHKPFEVSELKIRVHNLIEQRRKLKFQYKSKYGLKPEDIATTSADQAFLEKTIHVLEKNIADPNFSVEDFASHMALSRVQLYRKIHGLTGQSTSEFVRVFRLNRASKLLKERTGTVSQIAYQVGFNSSSYFYRSFQKHFGIPPSEYADSFSHK